ncbi:MAG TPA: phosphate/phosphite/phosphonate ABC transporter substrate-binding protein [Pirellulales bacterium]|nr:phosphate/phosphite/phosphonate ABC transporter substrate-binding protein [Pirellulales bacterium]
MSATSPPATARRDPATLKVALLPDESPSTVIKDNEPLKEYLTKRIGKEIELVVTTDYSSMIEAVRHGRIDIAYLGPLSYCLAKSKCDIEPFAAKLQHGATTYQSVIVANAESSIASLADIKGQTMAYGDTASTSSHLIPKSMLVAEGLLVDRGDYKEVFVGNHDAVLINVARGNAQAGGLSKPIYESLIERRVVDPDKVRVVAESKPYPQYPWAMQTDLAADLKQRIKDAFYQLDDKQVLGPLKADGFAPVADEDYEPIRELAKILDLDLSQAK